MKRKKKYKKPEDSQNRVKNSCRKPNWGEQGENDTGGRIGSQKKGNKGVWGETGGGRACGKKEKRAPPGPIEDTKRFITKGKNFRGKHAYR